MVDRLAAGKTPIAETPAPDLALPTAGLQKKFRLPIFFGRAGLIRKCEMAYSSSLLEEKEVSIFVKHYATTIWYGYLNCLSKSPPEAVLKSSAWVRQDVINDTLSLLIYRCRITSCGRK